jgi:hypothetical protein
MSTRQPWPELTIERVFSGTNFQLSGFDVSEVSEVAFDVSMSTGDWRLPAAVGNFLAHVDGPAEQIIIITIIIITT